MPPILAPIAIRLLPRHSFSTSSFIPHNNGLETVPAKELLKRVEAIGYEQGAPQAKNSIKDNTEYVRKTLKGHH